MADSESLPKVGTSRRVTFNNGMTRIGLIVCYDFHHEMAYMQWVDYAIPNEWITVRELQNG